MLKSDVPFVLLRVITCINEVFLKLIVDLKETAYIQLYAASLFGSMTLRYF